MSTAVLTPITRTYNSVDNAILCAQVGQDNKAKDIVVLDLRKITPIYDYLVLMTGASRRQMHAIAEEVDEVMSQHGEKRLSIEGYQTSRWIVQDYGDVVVHVFDADTRAYYALEELWPDAPRIDWKRAE